MNSKSIFQRVIEKVYNGMKPGDGIVQSCLIDAALDGDDKCINDYKKLRDMYEKNQQTSKL